MASPASIEALTDAQAKQYNAAFQLLSSGRAGDALAIARRVAGEAPNAPDAHQLLAMCHADVGDVAAADSAFKRALHLVPGNALILTNYATMLRKYGRLDEALSALQKATEVAPSHARAWIDLGVTALGLGKYEQARVSLARGLELQPDSALAWHALGNAQRAGDDLDAAESAFRKAVSLAPEYATAWANLGAVTRLLGRSDEAVVCFQRAQQTGYASPELANVLAGTLRDGGRPSEAVKQVKQLINAHPDFAPGYLTFAHILWENSDASNAGEATAMLCAAVQNRPGNRELRLTYARFLLAARQPEEALEQIRILRAADDDPQLVLLEANTLEALDRTPQSGALYEQLRPVLGQSDATYLNAHARHLLRVGDWHAAAATATAATRLNPSDQEAWAYLGTAWRLLNDPREYWLCDYERLVGLVEVEPPAGFNSMADFLAALSSTLEPLHQATREPVQQSLRGGSQTSGRLFGRRDPMLEATREVLVRAIEGWVRQLPQDVSHPCLARKAPSIRMSGSWSVRLWSSGNHVNHFHPDGWLSSAFYVSLPSSVATPSDVDSSAGCIQFGQPPVEMGLDLPPRRVIRPEAGRLALFPSYMWHGTVPFEDQQPRLTIACDMVPAAR